MTYLALVKKIKGQFGLDFSLKRVESLFFLGFCESKLFVREEVEFKAKNVFFCFKSNANGLLSDSFFLDQLMQMSSFN